MLHAPTEESPRISAIRVMHFSIAPSIPLWGRGKDESKGDRERETEIGGEEATARRRYIAPSKSRYISRVRANPPPAAYTPTNPRCVYVRVCCVCLSIPHTPQLAVDIKYVSH